MHHFRNYVAANLVPGLRARPSSVRRSTWLLCLPYAAFALSLGLTSGLLVPSKPTWFDVLILPALLVIYPCLIEESIFRGLLLPRSLRTASRSRQCCFATVSTAAFVAIHPLNAMLVGLSDTSQFTNPVFLVIVAALGYTCSWLYLRSGSLWAPIALHWATVLAWNLFLGRTFEM